MYRRCRRAVPGSARGDCAVSTTVTLVTQADRELCEQAQAVPERVANGFPAVDLATDGGAAIASTMGLAFQPGVLLEGVEFSHGPLPEHRLYHELLQVGEYRQRRSSRPGRAS